MSQRHTCVTVISWPSPQHSPRQTPSWEPSRTRTHWRPSPHKQPADTPGSCVQKTADVGCYILQNIWASGQMADHRAATPWYVEVLAVRYNSSWTVVWIPKNLLLNRCFHIGEGWKFDGNLRNTFTNSRQLKLALSERLWAPSGTHAGFHLSRLPNLRLTDMS